MSVQYKNVRAVCTGRNVIMQWIKEQTDDKGRKQSVQQPWTQSQNGGTELKPLKDRHDYVLEQASETRATCKQCIDCA